MGVNHFPKTSNSFCLILAPSIIVSHGLSNRSVTCTLTVSGDLRLEDFVPFSDDKLQKKG